MTKEIEQFKKNVFIEVSKLSLKKDDLLVIKAPVEFIGTMTPVVLQELADRYKDKNIQIMLLPLEVDISKMNKEDLDRINLQRKDNKIAF